MTAGSRARFMLAVCVVGVFSATEAYAVDPEVARLIDEGNAAYASGQYETALATYGQAEVDCPECSELAYNKALVHYRIRDFEKARELFNTALATRDLNLEANCKFNLGNVAYSQALEKLANLEEAIESARQAINHYRDALELDPEDVDARANIEIAQLLIKDLLDKQKQQQEQEKQNQDQQDQQDQQPQEQDSSNQEQQEGQEEQPQDEQQQQGEQEQNQQQDQEQGEQNQDQQNAEQDDSDQQAQAAEAKMTQEEAERILQGVRDKEAKRREEKARRMRGRRVGVAKDW